MTVKKKSDWPLFAQKVDRKTALKTGMKIGGVGLAASPFFSAMAAICGLTPQQTEGPFYPEDAEVEADADLTRLKGRASKAEGQVIYLSGIVMDQNCRPVPGALVEIWQACKTGRYKHPGDSGNPSPLDPNFQYYGKVLSDGSGKYTFKTIIPGSYLAAENWVRPPHIHFKVAKRAYVELITQMYFRGEPHNDRDLILQRLSAEDRDKVIVNLQEADEGMETGSKKCSFDIQIEKLEAAL